MRFQVTYLPIRAERDVVIVRTAIVDADYYKVEGGALIFRTYANRTQYPDAAHTFAAGVWAEVKNAD